MGNKIGKRKVAVDEQFTKPQGLYEHHEIDLRRLRKLILDGKLSPCYNGAEEGGVDLEECPICLLCYPSLNRSKCCGKGICTECFLQLRPPPSSRNILCPFCKTPTFAVEYRGEKTAEEKGAEQEEEQKILEARIRMLAEERRADEERQERMQEDPSYQRRLQEELIQQQLTLNGPQNADAASEGAGSAQPGGAPGAGSQQTDAGAGGDTNGTGSGNGSGGASARTGGAPGAGSDAQGTGAGRQGAMGRAQSLRQGHTAPPLGGAGSSGSRSGIFSRGSSSRGGAEGSATSSSVASSSLAGSGSSSSRHAAGTKASGFSVGSGRRASSVGIQPTQLLLSRSALAAASASASSGHAGGPHGTQPGSLAAAAQLDAQMVRQGRIVEVELDHHYERGLEPLAENFLEGGVFSLEDGSAHRAAPYARLSLSPEYNAMQQPWLARPRGPGGGVGGRGGGSTNSSWGPAGGTPLTGPFHASSTPLVGRSGADRDRSSSSSSTPNHNGGVGSASAGADLGSMGGVPSPPPPGFPASRFNLIIPRGQAGTGMDSLTPAVLLSPSASSAAGQAGENQPGAPGAHPADVPGSFSPTQQQLQQQRTLLYRHHHQHVHQHIHEYLYEYPRHGAGTPHAQQLGLSEAAAAAAAEVAVNGGEDLNLEDVLLMQAIWASLQDQPGRAQQEGTGGGEAEGGEGAGAEAGGSRETGAEPGGSGSSQAQTQSQLQSQPQPQPQPQSQPQAEAQSQARTQSQSQSQTRTQGRTQAGQQASGSPSPTSSPVLARRAGGPRSASGAPGTSGSAGGAPGAKGGEAKAQKGGASSSSSQPGTSGGSGKRREVPEDFEEQIKFAMALSLAEGSGSSSSTRR